LKGGLDRGLTSRRPSSYSDTLGGSNPAKTALRVHLIRQLLQLSRRCTLQLPQRSALCRCLSALPLSQRSVAVSALCSCLSALRSAAVALCRCLSALPLSHRSAAVSALCSCLRLSVAPSGCRSLSTQHSAAVSLLCHCLSTLQLSQRSLAATVSALSALQLFQLQRYSGRVKLRQDRPPGRYLSDLHCAAVPALCRCLSALPLSQCSAAVSEVVSLGTAVLYGGIIAEKKLLKDSGRVGY